MKHPLPPYDDDVAYEIDDILEEMHIDYDGDIENGIAIPKSKLDEFENRLRQHDIDYEEYDEDRSSPDNQGISFFR
jgi:hypothetical protein